MKITPQSNVSGLATITITASDPDGGITEREFGVTVVGLNDPPEMTAIADQTVDEDASLQTIILGAISPGPADESTQIVVITATSSNPGLIANPVVEYASLSRSLSAKPFCSASVCRPRPCRSYVFATCFRASLVTRGRTNFGTKPKKPSTTFGHQSESSQRLATSIQ